MYTAFQGTDLITFGSMAEIAQKLTEYTDRSRILVFDDSTGEVVPVVESDIDTPALRTAGRPRLGVVAREVTLLPRHWDWLNTQPGGASVALRKLVEQARRSNEANDRIRLAREAAYRFMSALAGNEPNFEEALRALFAGKKAKFDHMIVDWPADVRDHAMKLAGPSFNE